MPAVNTPQFSWVRSRLPHQPQPVPPIYQPEVAARAVVFAADHPRPSRGSTGVGGTTAATILANRAAPGLHDRYLARTGYSSQQTDQAAQPARADNLDAPVDGPAGSDHGAHGAFDDRSHHRSAQLWLSQHSRLIVSAGRADRPCWLARRSTGLHRAGVEAPVRAVAVMSAWPCALRCGFAGGARPRAERDHGPSAERDRMPRAVRAYSARASARAGRDVAGPAGRRTWQLGTAG